MYDWICHVLVMQLSMAVMPVSLHTEVLDGLHVVHQDVMGMKARAHVSVYWPGLSAAVVNCQNSCRQCDIVEPSSIREPFQLSNKPDYPFQLTAAGNCEVAAHRYLVYADRYSAWTSVSAVGDGHSYSRSLISELHKWFAIYGVPEEITTDGGPLFISHEVQSFLHWMGATHRLSSVHYSQSNGHAETAIKTVKCIIHDHTIRGSLDSDVFIRALLQHHNTPLQESRAVLWPSYL